MAQNISLCFPALTNEIAVDIAKWFCNFSLPATTKCMYFNTLSEIFCGGGRRDGMVGNTNIILIAFILKLFPYPVIL